MKKMPLRLSCLCLIISLCVIDTIAQEQLHTLSLNSPIERELAGAQTHTYTLSLKPGQIAQIYVIPASAVPHIIGVSMQSREGFRRVLITP